MSRKIHSVTLSGISNEVNEVTGMFETYLNNDINKSRFYDGLVNTDVSRCQGSLSSVLLLLLLLLLFHKWLVRKVLLALLAQS